MKKYTISRRVDSSESEIIITSDWRSSNSLTALIHWNIFTHIDSLSIKDEKILDKIVDSDDESWVRNYMWSKK